MLTLPPGQVTAAQAAEFVSQIRALGTDALPATRRLLETKSDMHRILGAYLLLETQGEIEEALRFAAEDQSPHVKAEVARWLFLERDFVRWDSFMRESANAITEHQIHEALVLLDQDPPRLDVPAAMSLLNLGRATPSFLSDLASAVQPRCGFYRNSANP